MQYNYFYYVIEYRTKTSGQHYVTVNRVCENDNLLPIIRRWERAYMGMDLIYIQQCKTHKQAQQIAEVWTDAYKTNNMYVLPWTLDVRKELG